MKTLNVELLCGALNSVFMGTRIIFMLTLQCHCTALP